MLRGRKVSRVHRVHPAHPAHPARQDRRVLWARRDPPVLQVPSVRQAISGAQAADIIGGSPQQFDDFIKSELKRWPEVVKAAGIKME